MTAADRGTSLMGVLCVDDNEHVADALRTKLSRTQDFEWRGWLPDATGLVQRVRAECPSAVLLDLDMPGPDPFAALAELVRQCPEVRAVVFSGLVKKDLIERAIEAGAWGYVAKSDGEEALIEALRRVMVGEVALSKEVQATWSL